VDFFLSKINTKQQNDKTNEIYDNEKQEHQRNDDVLLYAFEPM
jgi:hypothetical protein